ncbi:hypothetical protein [Streptomyces abyssomicinicus]|uniref:hypothetical protein n=1 Tax=Streptomyces abyssomicinicus TaxID=574929 RepID=UPI001250BAA6|nr:hypothetical protein [Streptomyces abyssomicinicus]
MEQRPSLEGLIRGLGAVPDPATGAERLHRQGYSYHLDLPCRVLTGYEPDELEQVASRIGEPYGVWVACRSMDAARLLLRRVLDGFDGLRGPPADHQITLSPRPVVVVHPEGDGVAGGA